MSSDSRSNSDDRQPTHNVSSVLRRQTPAWLLVALGLVCLATALSWLLHQVFTALHPFAVEYAEGPLLNQALLLARGDPLYRALDTPPYVLANYPPLYPWLVSRLLSLTGPALWPGRLLSLLATLVVYLEIFLLMRVWTPHRRAAWLAVIFFLAFPAAYVWPSLHRVDMTGLACSLGAAVLLTRWPQRSRAAALAGLLLAASLFTKQTFIFAALAILSYAWQRANGAGRSGWQVALRRNRWLLLSFGATIALGALYWQQRSHGWFLPIIILGNVNPFSLTRLALFWWAGLIGVAPIFLAAAVWRLRQPATTPEMALWRWYGLAALLSAGLIGKAGSDLNYFLELAVTLACAGGMAVADLTGDMPEDNGKQSGGPAVWRRLALLLLLIQMVWLLVLNLRTFATPSQLRQRTLERQALLALIEATPGPVLADEGMDALLLARRPVWFEPYVFTQLAALGRWDETPLLSGLAQTQFDLIIINPRLRAQRWSPALLAQIERHYEMTGLAGNLAIYRPRPH